MKNHGELPSIARPFRVDVQYSEDGLGRKAQGNQHVGRAGSKGTLLSGRVLTQEESINRAEAGTVAGTMVDRRSSRGPRRLPGNRACGLSTGNSTSCRAVFTGSRSAVRTFQHSQTFDRTIESASAVTRTDRSILVCRRVQIYRPKR